jgi:serine/threonine protein kinase/TolB-like protein/tetratricopeptide (TPR) repeat protein
MIQDSWQRVDDLLQSAMDCEPSQRAAFLNDACAGDHALRQQVEALLAADREAGDFLERPAIEAGTSLATESPTRSLAGRSIGAYRLVRELGRGGMGTVYLAERADGQFRKQVAIKLVKRGMDSDAILQRFHGERQILARLDHPHIASLLDGGTTDDGVSYFVMEYVDGQPIDVYCMTHSLSTRERLHLFRLVCAAVQHAHEHGVVHRDLKPTNILVTEDGVPKLLDFGIAKLLASGHPAATAKPTTVGLRPMTPAYASPEQVRGEPVTPASDVYALGVLLYELLTGCRPYYVEDATAAEIARAVCEQEPEKPSTAVGRHPEISPMGREALDVLGLASSRIARHADEAVLRRSLTGDLDNITMMALRKEPSRRYGSVAEFAEDVRRHLERRPVLARGNGLAYRAGRFVTRNKTAVVSAVAGVMAAVAAIAVAPLISRDRGPTTASMPRIRSVAVLPLDNLSADPDQEYLSAGMTEALISDLATIRSLRVISRTSVMRYEHTQKSLPDIARELNVDAILEGAVRQSAGRIRITAQLIEPATQRRLWNDTYERDAVDVLALQSEVARAVTRGIAVAITPQEETRLASTRPVDAEAHRLYLWGRLHLAKRTKAGMTSAIDYFERAIERDPTYAPAYASLALTYGLSSADGYAILPFADGLSKARAAALRALQLDDTLAEAHMALGEVLLWADWDWAGARQAFQRAIELSPGDVGVHLGYSLYLTLSGRLDEGLTEARRAVELDPLALGPNSYLAWAYYRSRKLDEALEQARVVLELDPNYDWRPAGLRGHVFLAKGMYREAIREYEKVAASPHTYDTRGLAWLGHARARSGDTRGALELLDEIRTIAKRQFVPAFHIALIYVGLGDKDQAFAWLEKAYAAREPAVIWLNTNPLIDSLRSDPRYTDLLERVGHP